MTAVPGTCGGSCSQSLLPAPCDSVKDFNIPFSAGQSTSAIWPILQPARILLAAFCIWFFARKHKPARLIPLPNLDDPQIEDQPATCLANIPSER